MSKVDSLFELLGLETHYTYRGDEQSRTGAPSMIYGNGSPAGDLLALASPMEAESHEGQEGGDANKLHNSMLFSLIIWLYMASDVVLRCGAYAVLFSEVLRQLCQFFLKQFDSTEGLLRGG